MGLFSRSSSSGTAVLPEPVTPSVPTGAGPAVPAPVPARPSVMHAPTAPRGEREIYFDKMKVRIHQQLVERLDVQNLKLLPPETVRQEVRALIRELCQSEKGLLN